jgi:hypothetical protein
MLIKMPPSVSKIIENYPYNATAKKGATKIYACLYLMSMRRNKDGYFFIPSEYMRKVNARYNRTIDYFIKVKLIKPYTRPSIDPNSIFENKDKRYYDVNKGICMRYKFLKDVYEGDDVWINMKSNREYRWYNIIENSLLECGYNVWIKRDTYGRRVHHSCIKDYREDFGGYWIIDSICSQPRLLWLHMKEKNIYDKVYFDIFDNGDDFYNFLIEKLKLNDRNEAKDLFMKWAMGNGYLEDYNIQNLFEKTSAYLKSIKKDNYKNAGSLLQRIESKIWIDTLLNELPVDFAIPIHDALIVKEKDVDVVLDFCKLKYPTLLFKKEKIVNN